MPIRARTHPREGNIATIVALGAVVLLSFAALTIDLGYGRLVQQQLENASEAGARGGSLKLDGTEAGLTAARITAASMAAQNIAGGGSVVLADEDIVLGVWDATTGTFTPSSDPLQVNTVQVRARIDALGLFLTPAAFARDTIPVSGMTRAMAMSQGAGEVQCYIPLALPDCVVDREGVEGIQDLTLQLNPPGVDNVGWGRANGSPSASWARDMFGDCESSGAASVGDPVGLGNGAMIPALTELVTQINGSDTTWDPTKWGTLPARMTGSSITPPNYGRTFEGPIMVVDTGDEYCTGSGGSWTGNRPLKGFMWASIYDVKNSGGAVAERNIRLRVDTSSLHDLGTSSGGPDYGVVSTTPVMVRND
jgi:hypothetical protein